MGLPVVATNIGGSVEQVADGETGYLVVPGDAVALADKLELLLRDEALRTRFGQAGRQRVAKQFTLPGMVEKIVRVYDDCLSGEAVAQASGWRATDPRQPEACAAAASLRSPRTARSAVPAKVLLVNNSADIYGASRCLLRIVKLLDRTKFEPIVLMPGPGPLENDLRDAKIRTIIFPELSVIERKILNPLGLMRFVLNFPLSVIGLRRILKEQQIDLVHTNTGVMLSPGLAACLAGVPNVWHIRDWFLEFPLFWKFYSRYIHAFSSRILAVSDAVAGQFPASFGATVLHDGFELAEFAISDPAAGAKFRAEYGLGDGLVVGCVGRIKLIRKGQEVLLRAAGLLKQRGVRARYVIVGAPFPGNEWHLDELAAIIREHGLEGDVVFTGELENPLPAYAAMDVFVLPSAQPEPFGGVVMEAMCRGLPVIATNSGGSVQQVADGETGYLVPPGNAPALAAKLELLLGDAALRRQFGEAGQRRIEERFDLKKMVERIEGVYEECLHRK